MAAHNDHTHGTNLRCSFPECEGIKFKSRKELRRHAKGHDPDSTRWYCGCCQNLGERFKPNPRKDKVQDHLRNKHETSRSEEKKTIGISCPVEGCYTLFTALSCLDRHFKQYSTHTSELSYQLDNGRCITLTHL